MRLGVFNSGLFIEFRQASLRVLQGEQSLSLPLERQPNGRLTSDCKEKLTAALQNFLKKKNWQPRLRAVCAIDARGVSLRRLSVPANARQDFENVLRLQLESEFPLPPEELAWGCLQREQRAGTLENGKRELTVVAVKKDIVEDYAQLLSACGINPLFTLAALARTWTFPSEAGPFAVLDIGLRHSELITFENGEPTGLRVLNWGGEYITREIEQRLGVTREEAEKLKLQWDEDPGSNGELGKTVPEAIAAALDSLAETINETWTGPKLFLTGRSTGYKELPRQLAQRLRGATQCEKIGSAASNGSAAIVGLQTTSRVNGGEPPLIIALKETKTGEQAGQAGRRGLLAQGALSVRQMLAKPAAAKWARLAVILAVAAICFPFVEALALKPFFVKRLAAIKAEKARLPMIDRELSFLQYLKQNQPPYLDTLTILACSTGPGTRFDSIAINRRGELAIKGNMKDATQVSDFRSKLIKSGYFSSVTVEEQNPSQDRQKVAVRMTAQIKPLSARASVSVDSILSNAPPVTPGSGGFGGPEMMFPGGMPMPAMPMPGPMPGSARPPTDAPKTSAPKMEKGKPTRTIKVGDGTVEVSPGSVPISVPSSQP
jgi:type IV pilus assembly protein PilM